MTVRFTARDQRRFATLSGDWNEIHVDAAAARRLVGGRPIVHGMQLALGMMDLVRRRDVGNGAVRIDAAFLRPAFLDEDITINVECDGSLCAHAADVPLARVSLSAADAKRDPPKDARGRATKLPRRPRTRTMTDLDGAAGTMVLPGPAPLARAFPGAARLLGAEIVAALAGTSALVGMECPGRHSLLSAAAWHIWPNAAPRRLNWRVERVDRRFGLVRVSLEGSGFTGHAEAFLRPAAIPAPTLADADARVRRGEFAGQRALVIGGSRGLGAATALLVVAGGGSAVVTYASGAAEAAALRRASRDSGRPIDTFQLDVTRADAAAVVVREALRHRVTHVYYFATPRIFTRRRAPFDAALFEGFALFYVGAFARLCAALSEAGRTTDVFYPSTISVDDTPAELTEYAAAKAAGEHVCTTLARSLDGVRPFVFRLPRVLTDQTASVVPVAAASSIDTMLPIVREMQRRKAQEPG